MELQVDVSCQAGVECPVDDATWQLWLSHWWQQLELNASGEVSIHLTDDQEMQALNAQFRQKDAPTDVLAFVLSPLDVADVETPSLLGDIIISIDTAREQAESQNHSLAIELAWLASHGLLHLVGWDHPDGASLEAMLTQQRRLLENAGIIAAAST